MLIEKTPVPIKYINKAGKHQIKIIEIGDRLTKSRNTFLRVTCITRDNRLFIFPIYPNGKGMELIKSIAYCIGNECIEKLDDEEIINTNNFVGGFITVIIKKYAGDNELYQSGYYVTDVSPSQRRYDKTKSRGFKRATKTD